MKKETKRKSDFFKLDTPTGETAMVKKNGPSLKTEEDKKDDNGNIAEIYY